RTPVEPVRDPTALRQDERSVIPAYAGHGNDRHARTDRLAYEPVTSAENSLIASAPVAHRVNVTSRPDDHVAPGAERRRDALAGGGNHAGLGERIGHGIHL